MANILCTAEAVLKIKEEKRKEFTATESAALELNPCPSNCKVDAVTAERKIEMVVWFK